ncbi:thioredoxin family protein [Lysinimonas soli]|uniref:Thioredoxin n=1 Tax=Lysinimonas soli TaxID=1074233 RepID=A0ABW0NSS8_9MICO
MPALHSSVIRSVTDADFGELVLAASGPVVVDFWAEWCPPCRALSPLLEQLAIAHPEVAFVALNADDNPMTAEQYRAAALPTMKVFRGGEVVKTVIGAKPKPALEQLFAEYFDQKG